jgi:oligopeptide/dipeptide ABC transporter ATP-binding protein
MAAESLLSISELSVEYPTADGSWHAVVEKLSLELLAGERVALVGESGSGKSVTALAALGLVIAPGRQSSGSVSVGGRELASATPAELRRIRGGEVGVVFQEPTGALNPVLTVGHQLIETMRAHRAASPREARAEACRLLDELAVRDPNDILRAYPHQLSGGQLQRVMIALALAGRPRLLIADEPTTALDLQTQAQILGLLRRITADGMALLLISHDLAVVAGLVERTVVVYAGRVVEEAPTASLFEQPFHPYTRLLLAAGRRDTNQGRPPVAAASSYDPQSGGCRFAPRCALARSECRAFEAELLQLGSGRKLRCPVVLEEISDG